MIAAARSLRRTQVRRDCERGHRIRLTGSSASNYCNFCGLRFSTCTFVVHRAKIVPSAFSIPSPFSDKRRVFASKWLRAIFSGITGTALKHRRIFCDEVAFDKPHAPQDTYGGTHTESIAVWLAEED